MKRNERRKFRNSERLKRSNEVFSVPICGSRQLFVLRQLAVENQYKINNEERREIVSTGMARNVG
jgi:hypothetical protein